MTKSDEIKIGLLWFAVMLNGIAAVYAAIELRPLYVEGVHWLFVIESTGRPFLDAHFSRYADILPQLPTLALIRIFPGVKFTDLPNLVFSFSYALQPLLLLGVAIAYLWKKERIEFIPFLLTSFALATQTVNPAAQMIVQQTLGIFWLALLVLLFGENRWRTTFLFTFLCCLLSATHEVAFVCFGFLIWVIYFEFKVSNFKIQKLVYICVMVPLSAWICYRVNRVNDTDLFTGSVLEPWGYFRVYSLICLIIFAGSISTRIKAKWPLFIFGLLSVTFLILELTDIGRLSLRESYNARTTAVPFAFILSAVMVWIVLKKISFTHEMKIYLVTASALFLFVSATHDYLLTHSWSVDLHSFEEALTNSPNGCHDILESSNVWKSPNLSGDRISLYSLVFQNKVSPSKVLFSSPPIDENACDIFHKKGFINLGWGALRYSRFKEIPD